MSFELDESGRPYWTVTTYENTAFWGLPEANGVLVCDAQTGECELYSIDAVSYTHLNYAPNCSSCI